MTFVHHSSLKFFFSPNTSRDIYYPLLHEDGRSSIQMASVMDMNNNYLILDEIVVRDRVYKLEQFRQFYDLQPIGILITRIYSQ